MAFYAIHCAANEHGRRECDDILIFNDKKEAFDRMKNFKEARVKSFAGYREALHFTQCGLDNLTNNTYETTSSPISQAGTLEKSPFRGPKSQDLVLFRKSIEQGKVDVVLETIWKNPRYLIGSGDTPTILKESFRYNAMHVAALSRSGKMCEALLKTIGDPNFIMLLYGKRNFSSCQEVSSILLDLYLNMPEKGRNETPLHLATKFGCVEVVEVLTSYPQCNFTVNSEGLFPKDVICGRIEVKNKEVVDQIAELLNERFYVPVIRSVDNSLPPMIGEPFSPTNPPNLIFDPLSPEMEIQAYAGPMNKEQAYGFRKRWKTPPRQQQSSPSTSSPYISPIQLRKFTPNKSASTPKSCERKGARQLFPIQNELNNFQANKNSPSGDSLSQNGDVVPKTDSANTDCTDMPPPQSLPIRLDPFKLYRDRKLGRSSDTQLDDSMNSSTVSEIGNPFDSPMYKERHLKLTDTEKGLEVIGRELAKDQNIKWREHWNFLDGFIDITSADGLKKLEAYLENSSDPDDNNHDVAAKVASALDAENKDTSISTLCNALTKLEVQDHSFSRSGRLPHIPPKCLDIMQRSRQDVESPAAAPVNPSDFSAYLCAEKSWQVYAKRMTHTIMQNLNSVVSINDALNSELKRLKSLILSYMKDKRFLTVNFKSAHSRFAHLIVLYLTEEKCNLMKVQRCLEQIQLSTQRLVMDNSDLRADIMSSNLQLQCLLKCLLYRLNNPCMIKKLKEMTKERHAHAIWEDEQKCNCAWLLEMNPSHPSSLKRHSRRFERLAASPAAAPTAAATPATSPDLTLKENMKDWHSTPITESSDDSDDEYEFLSDSGSDDDIYFTPQESLSACSTPDLDYSHDGDTLPSYRNFIFGDAPTKTDVDVLKALLNTDIDKTEYPRICQWKAAILRHTTEERDNFPSPSPTMYRGGQRSPSKLINELPVKCLFQPPAKQSSSPVKKSVTFANFLKPSSLESKLPPRILTKEEKKKYAPSQWDEEYFWPPTYFAPFPIQTRVPDKRSEEKTTKSSSPWVEKVISVSTDDNRTGANNDNRSLEHGEEIIFKSPIIDISTPAENNVILTTTPTTDAEPLPFLSKIEMELQSNGEKELSHNIAANNDDIFYNIVNFTNGVEYFPHIVHNIENSSQINSNELKAQLDIDDDLMAPPSSPSCDFSSSQQHTADNITKFKI